MFPLRNTRWFVLAKGYGVRFPFPDASAMRTGGHRPRGLKGPEDPLPFHQKRLSGNTSQVLDTHTQQQ